MKVIIVRGGLVASVYSERREKIYIFDYDGDDQREQDQYERETAELITKHKLKEIY